MGLMNSRSVYHRLAILRSSADSSSLPLSQMRLCLRLEIFAYLECEPQVPSVVPSLLTHFLGLAGQERNGLAAVGHERGSLEEGLAEVVVQTEEVLRGSAQLQQRSKFCRFCKISCLSSHKTVKGRNSTGSLYRGAVCMRHKRDSHVPKGLFIILYSFVHLERHKAKLRAGVKVHTAQEVEQSHERQASRCVPAGSPRTPGLQ